MAGVYWLNGNGRGGLNLSGSGASWSVFITKYSGDNINNNRMDEASVMDMRQETVYVIWWGNVRERNNLGELDGYRKTILEWICNKWKRKWIGFIWLWIGTSGGLLWTWSWNCRIHNMQDICWLSYQMLDYQEGICFTEFVWCVTTIHRRIVLFL